jgi:hypothetical protein
MSVGELVGGLRHVQDVCGFRDVDLRFELEWAFDNYYVNVWRDGVVVAGLLPVVDDFRCVWEWLAVNYPEFEWVG